MRTSRSGALIGALAFCSCSQLLPAFPGVAIHTETGTNARGFSPDQIAILEKINRADARHVARLDMLVVPDVWLPDEMAYSPLPKSITWAHAYGKYIVVHLPSQVFGAYEYGELVRWGPISSGRARYPTPAGLFHLNWRARSRVSTDNSNWRLEWYFNFHNRRGIAFHEYALPGRPASHACIRLLRRDAMWLFAWGEGWMLTEDGRKIVQQGTPVLVEGACNFDAPRPWIFPEWWQSPVEVPAYDPVLLTSSGETPDRID